MTLTMNDQCVTGLAKTTAQRVLDRLAEGLMDEPQEDLVNGTAREIEQAIRSTFRLQGEVWNRAWDM
jgi:hypothetical protein